MTSGSSPSALSSVSIDEGIRKSPLDQRAMNSLVLDNKIKVVTISDPLTSKAHVAINVGVGYASDPVEHPGLAHFTEHMVTIALVSSYNFLYQNHLLTCR